MPTGSHSRHTAFGLVLLLAACERPPEEAPESQDPAAGQAGNPLGFEVWHADFPGAPEQPHLSPRCAGRWYDRTRRQALESVAAKLQGNCSRDAWLMAKDFFSRIDADDVDVLARQLDLAAQSDEMADLAENTVEAIGRSGAPGGAEALLRALEHSRRSIRNKVMSALVGGGTAEVVRAARSMFPAVDGRGMEGWILAARAHLPVDEVVAQYRAILADDRLALVWKIVVENALELPPRDALAVFEPMIGAEPAELAATIAGLRHAAGDGAGTSLLADMLRRPEPQTRAEAVRALRFGGAAELMDDLLRLTTDPDPAVRLAVVEAIAVLDLSERQQERVQLTLEGLTIDEAQDVRRAALAVLRDMGRRQAVDELVEAVRTATGSRLTLALEDLIAICDGAAIEAMWSRAEGAPPSQRRDLLRAAALTTAPEGLAPLRETFLADDPFARENRAYVAYLMTNCRGAETAMLELMRSLPKGDYQRRAMMMGTLASVAADREDPILGASVYALFREVLADRTEIPQMRLAALGFLRRDLRIEDAAAIRSLADGEEPPMRNALMDFLFEFY